VLLADDSLTIQRVVSLTFADQPVRVVVAKDGQDAINRMESERPDLVLADTNMPCVDGYELARWVRGQPHLNTVPVLLLAGVTDPVDEQRLHDSGANGVLEKPFEPSHVISRVKELLGLKGAPPAAAGRLVTSPDVRSAPVPPPARRPGSSPSHPVAPGDRPTPPAESAARQKAGAAQDAAPAVSPFRAAQPVAPEQPAAASERSASELDTFDMAAHPGDISSWFAPETPVKPRVAALAEELGLRGSDYPAAASESPASRVTDSRASASAGAAARPGSMSSAADVFESLLAAEQGVSGGPVLVQAPPELTPAVLDDLSDRIADRLRPDLQSMGADVRSAVADAVQAAVSGSLLDGVRGAVNDAIAATVPAAIEQQVAASVDRAVATTVADLVRETVARQMQDTVVPAIRDTVRDVVDAAVRGALAHAVATAVPAAVLQAVRGDEGGEVRALVRETAERLVSEEIARIRQRRA
jgi:CheY-like chemotaxis protein